MARRIPSGDDFTIYFQLAYVLKRPTRQVVCFIYRDHLSWIEGEVLERRINVGHDVVLLLNWQVQALSCDKKKPRDEQGNFALTPRGIKTYRFVGVILARKPPNGL